MCDITIDIEQWLLMDEKVVRKWRSFAWRLNLVEYVGDIECWRGGGGSRRRGGREKDKLEMLLRIWKEKKPDTYTVSMLKTVLSAEGLTDMWMWINIITQDYNIRSHTRLSSTTTSPTPTSPWSRHLYNSPVPTSYSSYSQSSYSPLPSSPSLSRPDSQLSEYSLYRLISPAPCHSQSGYTSSCPTTPLSCRRHHHSSPQPASPYRSSHTPNTSPARRGVYHTLYRPDLIKLSSSRPASRRWKDSNEVYSGGMTSEKCQDHKSLNQVNPRFCGSKHCENDTNSKNIVNLDYKTDSSTPDYDYSIVYDELLEELEADLKNLNCSVRKVKSNIDIVTKPNRDTSDKHYSDNKNKQLFYVDKVKMVELGDLKIDDIGEKTTKYSDTSYNIPSPGPLKGQINTHEEYFNNLLMMIEKAAQGLNV